MLKIPCACCLDLSQAISAQFTLEMCVAARNRVNKITKKTLFGGGVKVVDLDVNQRGVWDLLLVINSNLGPISHRFRDTATYWLKVANFPYPPLI